MAGLDASNVQNETDVEGNRRPSPGIYHMVVDKVDATYDEHDAVIVTVSVLAGSPNEKKEGDQKGRSIRHMMFLDDDGNYGDQHLRFALATGLIRPGENKDVDWNEAEGRQFIAGVEKRYSKKSDKEFTQISNYGMDIWSVNNPEVAKVPKDKRAIEMLGDAVGGQAGSSSGSQAKSDDDDLDDI